VTFPFLDLDGNLCHDPGDSGDLTPLLTKLGHTGVMNPFVPAAGSMDCPAGAKLKIEPGPPSAFDVSWVIPESLVLDCRLIFTHSGGLPLNTELEATDDILVGEKALVRTTKTGLLLSAGGTVSLADRAKLRSSKGVRVIGQDVLIGEGVRFKTGRSFDIVRIDADPIVGIVQTGKISLRAESAHITAGSIDIGQKSKLTAHHGFDVTAETSIVMDGVRIRGNSGVIDVILNTPGTIALTNSLVKLTNGITLTTPPGGVCDVTGTTFVGSVPTYSGCTVIGP
jgi:hypothetical protein